MKHVAVIIPEAGKELLQRVSAVMMRVEFPEAVLLDGRVAVDASNRTMQAFELAEALECDTLQPFSLEPVVRPSHTDWTLVPLPAYQPELRLVWEASALCLQPLHAPTIWLGLVHPVDPLGGAVLPPLESCRVRFTKNATFLSGRPLPRRVSLTAYWPAEEEYAAPTAPVAAHLHQAATAFVVSDAWHATVLAAASQAREWVPFTATVREEERLTDADGEATSAPASPASGDPRPAGRRRLLGRASAGGPGSDVVAVGDGEEPVDAAAFQEGVQAAPQLRATPEVAAAADGDGGLARFRAAQAEAEAKAKATAEGGWSVRGADGRFADPDRTPALFDRVPKAYEARSAEDVQTQHVFLQQNEAATALDVMLVGMRDAYEGHALPELKASGYPHDRPTRAAVRTARVLREQDVSLSFIEASSKVSTLMQVGVKSREVFSMIVDSIMNHLPEILSNVIMAVAAEPVINMVGKALSCVLPPLLVPSTGAVPCIAPGADGLAMPVTEVESPPCVCAGPMIPVFDFLQLSDAGFLPKSGDKGCSCSNAPGAALVETRTGGTDRDALASTMLHHMKAKAEDQSGPLPKIMEKATPNINEAIKSNAMPSVESNVAVHLSNSLPERVRTQTHRKTTRILLTELTRSVTVGVVQELSRLLGRELTFTTTRTLVRSLVPTLTHSLAPAMTMALTHSPKSDYYCAYCSSKKMYCEYCAKSKQADYMTEYYTNYYASYYSSYFTENYVSIGDLISQETFK